MYVRMYVCVYACMYVVCMCYVSMYVCMYIFMSLEEGEGRPPISVKFEIPYFTTSGIQVLYACSITSPSFNVCTYIHRFVILRL